MDDTSLLMHRDLGSEVKGEIVTFTDGEPWDVCQGPPP